jgi:hypothetical protein
MSGAPVFKERRGVSPPWPRLVEGGGLKVVGQTSRNRVFHQTFDLDATAG